VARVGVERTCRYGSRPALATRRVVRAGLAAATLTGARRAILLHRADAILLCLAGGKLGTGTVEFDTAHKLTHSLLQRQRSQYRSARTACDGEGVTMLRPGDLALNTAIGQFSALYVYICFVCIAGVTCYKP
jgi:hypothetical protein